MNNQNKTTATNKKVGEDGLTKKERRALRIAQKSDGSGRLQQQTEAAKNVSDSKNRKHKVIVAKNESEQNDLKTSCNENKSPDSKLEKTAQENEISTNKNNIDCNKTEESGIHASKVQLRAERRALQEKQREAKVTSKPQQNSNKQQNKKEIQSPLSQATIVKKNIALKSESLNASQVNRLCHITDPKITEVHPSVIRLGVQYASKTILGSNARCLALLCALKDMTNDFFTPPKQEFCRSLEGALQNGSSYLKSCRRFSVSMTNMLKQFQLYLTQICSNGTDADKKENLLQWIDTYREEQIAKAGEAICMKVNEKVTNDDVILTYGCSSLIKRLLLDAHRNGKKFKVIVIDSRPLLEGREMLRVLVNHGIDCTYLLINSVSFIMSKATKVLLGAHALLANGYVMSRMGTAQVALVAQVYSKPVLVCCETYKFCERVQTDCFVNNETGDPDKLLRVDTLGEDSPLMKVKASKNLKPLDLLYDITPTDLVTAVVTELGFLPCTSVPVVLRIKPIE